MLKRLLSLLPALALAVALYYPHSPASSQTPTWQNVTPGGLAARSIAVDPTHPGTVYAGLQTNTADNSGGQGIWKSVNYGATWARVDVAWAPPCGALNGIVMAITVDPFNGNVYATNVYGCDQGVFRSTNGGVNWTNIKAGDFNRVSVDPQLPGHLLASYHSRHDICQDECDTGVVESLDGGATWSTSAVIPGSGWGQYVHFISSSVWFVTTQYHGGFRSTNSGASWTKVFTSPALAYGDLARSGAALFTGVQDGVLRSLDNGANWSLVYNDNSPDYVMGLAVDATGKVYTRSSYAFGSYQGQKKFVASSDGGATWSPFAQDFNYGANAMATDSQYVYAAMWGGGLWRLPVAGGPPPTPTNTPAPLPTATNTPPPTPTPTGTPAPCHEVYEQGGVIKVSATPRACG